MCGGIGPKNADTIAQNIGMKVIKYIHKRNQNILEILFGLLPMFETFWGVAGHKLIDISTYQHGEILWKKISECRDFDEKYVRAIRCC